MLNITVLLSSPTYMLLPTLSICFLCIVGLYSLKQSCLLPLITSHDNVLSTQFILSFSIQVDVLHVPVVYRFDHILYFYPSLKMCILTRQLPHSHTIFLLLVPVVLYNECVNIFSTSPEVGIMCPHASSCMWLIFIDIIGGYQDQSTACSDTDSTSGWFF